MTLVQAGFPYTEASNLVRHGIETVADLQSFVAAHDDWRDRVGRVVAIAVEQFLEMPE